MGKWQRRPDGSLPPSEIRAIEQELAKEAEQLRELEEALAEGDYVTAAEIARELEREHPGLILPPIHPVIPTVTPGPEPEPEPPCPRYIYATTFDGYVRVIDPTLAEEVASVSVAINHSILYLYFDHATEQVYVTVNTIDGSYHNEVDVFDSGLNLEGTVGVGTYPMGGTSDDERGLVFIPVSNYSSIAVIDVNTLDVEWIPISGASRYAMVDPADGTIYIAGENYTYIGAGYSESAALWRIDPGPPYAAAQLIIESHIVNSIDYPVEGYIRGVVPDFAHHKVYLIESHEIVGGTEAHLIVFDTATDTATSHTLPDATQYGIAYNATQDELYYVDAVTVYVSTPTGSGNAVATLTQGRFAGHSIDYDPARHLLYTATTQGILVFDTDTWAVVMSYPLQDIIDIELGNCTVADTEQINV